MWLFNGAVIFYSVPLFTCLHRTEKINLTRLEQTEREQTRANAIPDGAKEGMPRIGIPFRVHPMRSGSFFLFHFNIKSNKKWGMFVLEKNPSSIDGLKYNFLRGESEIFRYEMAVTLSRYVTSQVQIQIG
jgi:hypothetical protein